MNKVTCEKHIIVVTRTGLLAHQKNPLWRRAETLRRYKKDLFSKKHLDFRLWSLENLALKSVCIAKKNLAKNNISVKVTHCLLTSAELPDWAKEKLNAAVSRHSFVNVIYCGTESAYPSTVLHNFIKNLYNGESGSIIIAMVWLDDDDVLSDIFFDELVPYMVDPFVGFWVSFPNGITGFFNVAQKTYSDFRLWYKPKIALGLTYINKITFSAHKKAIIEVKTPSNLFDISSHQDVDEYSPIILDGRKVMWIRTAHDHMDSYALINKKGRLVQKTPQASVADIRQVLDFNFYPGFLVHPKSYRSTSENQNIKPKHKKYGPRYITRYETLIIALKKVAKLLFR